MRPNPARTLLSILVSLVILSSCQKEISEELVDNGNPGTGNPGGGTNNNSLLGDYDFVAMDARSVSSVTMTSGTDQMKTVTTTDYSTKNNSGAVKINATDMVTTNLVYSIDDMANVKTYMNGSLVDDSDYPFVFTMPSYSGTSTYTKVGTDSLKFSSFYGAATSPSTQTPASPVTTKYYWLSDTLVMKTATSVSQTVTQGGVPATMSADISATYKLKKK